MLRACRYMIFIVAALAVQAQAQVLTLDDARGRALANNPGLAEMRARYEALAELAPQQGALPDPVVSLAAANFPWRRLTSRRRQRCTRWRKCSCGLPRTWR